MKRNPRSIVYGCHSIYIHRFKNSNNIDIFVSQLQQHIIHYFNNTPTLRITPMFFQLDPKHDELNLQAPKIYHRLTFGQQMKKTTKFWTTIW